jgi:peptidyl-prolyl cis-trans isomerase B (cyclophilin B)
VAGSARRERQLAREHYERQQARRAARAAKRRRTQQIVAVVVAVLVIVLGIVGLSKLNGNGSSTPSAQTSNTPSASTTPSASASPSPSTTAAASGCAYSKAGTAAKDVGVPTYDAAKAASYKKPFTLDLATDQGDITIAMDAAKAPCTTNSFKYLAGKKYFDGTSCHRLTTSNIYVLQCGDPTGSGSGGPGYQFGEENLPTNAANNYPAGTVAMANAGAGTNGSQFFLVYKDTTLPPNYTIFGQITKGLDVVTAVAAKGTDNANAQGDGHPNQKITIKAATVGKS